MSFITKKRLLDHKGTVHGMGFSCEECGKSFRSRTSRNRHVSVVHQQQLNNNNTNTGVSDASCQPEPNTETSDDPREELKKQELKKKKKQEEIIKLLVEEELGRKLSSNGDNVTIESFITDLVLDEVWLRIQNQSPSPVSLLQ